MGSKRQQQRARARRQTSAPPHPRIRTPAVVGALLVILAAILGLAALAVRGSASGRDTATPTVVALAHGTGTAASAPKTIDGIPCVAEMLAYHVHAHLTILDAGKPVEVPAEVGILPSSGCLYWLHTHDNTGIIHVEGPRIFSATLGKFFDIWGQPLSSNRVAGISVKSGQRVKVWVNDKAITGNPRAVRLNDHTSITVEVGPPFPRPQRYDFSGV